MSPLSARGLAVHDDEVVVVDAGVDHGVALDAQQEVVVGPAQHRRNVDVLFDVLLGKDGRAGGDLPDERQRPQRTRRVDELEGARLGGVAPDESEPFEVAEMHVHRGRRGQLELAADLADRGRIAVRARELADEAKHLLLSCCQCDHASLLRVEHVFVCTCRLNTCSCQEAW